MQKKFSLFAGIVLANICYAQVLVPNAGFEQKNKFAKTQLANWQSESDNFNCCVDSVEFFKGEYSLKVQSKTDGNHFFNQEFPFASNGLRKYKLKCAIKTKNLEGRLQLGARVFDSNHQTITKSVFTLSEKKNQNWTIAEGFFISEKEAATIRLFGNIYGTGEAWFDEISIEEIPNPTKRPKKEITMYIHEYFDVVYENSIITDKTIIAKLKSKTMYLCGDGTSMNDCRHILQYYTTKKLNDGHSFFSTPREYKELMEEGKHPITGEVLHNFPTGKMLDKNVAYLTLPIFASSDAKLLEKYADTLQTLIALLDKQDTKGWIVDLSKNGGGNCFPMIAGIGPFIGNGVCEYSFSGDGSIKQIIYNNGWTGSAWVGGDSSLVLMKSNPYHLKSPQKPIAIIYGNGTASSGEVTAIAFIGLPNSKSFGQETYGISTRVDNFELSDGSFLHLVAGVDADRNRNKFGGKIKPDVETPDTKTAIEEATNWILTTAK